MKARLPCLLLRILYKSAGISTIYMAVTTFAPEKNSCLFTKWRRAEEIDSFLQSEPMKTSQLFNSAVGAEGRESFKRKTLC
jgi:hypothetical protein